MRKNNFNLFTGNYKILLGILNFYKEEYPNKQLGKTMIQKLCYLLTREDILDYDYSLYHYGPYSVDLESDLDILNFFDEVSIGWNQYGYDIEIKNQELKLDKLQAEKIKNVIENYGHYTATDLSLVATALYIKDNYGIDDYDLVDEVHNIKPNFNPEYIENVLQSAEII
ncbi:MAG: DUF4065 domain-containing protein [bacterium]|nr:DUF4065 domain-containing protein [bacterium]